MSSLPRMAIVVPVFDGAATLGECLAALLPGVADGDEIVVVDDGSRDGSAGIAEAAGVRIIRQAVNGGQAAARNVGVGATSGDVVLFVDADVVVAPDVIARVRQILATRAEIGAVFGSYDDRPRAGGVVSAYRNLLHHYVHQRGAAEAFTFWAGCGAVRRAAFEQVDGFDERPWRRAIEDIELGYRLRAAGHRLLLDPTLFCTHLKRWTLRSMLWTDTASRALPWTRLMIETPGAGSDLNLTLAQRLSVALVGGGLATGVTALVWPMLLWAALAAFGTVAFLNRDFYGYLARRRGAAFAAASIPLHLLYFVCSGVGFAWAWAGWAAGQRAPGTARRASA
ncbi:MAG: glycosyltransferase [Candidatus Binatia bacterium]